MSIIAAVDGEQIPDRAVEVGADLATQYDEEFVVVHVMSQDAYEKRSDSDTTANFGFPTAADANYGSTSGDAYTVNQANRDAAGVAEDITKQTLDALPADASYVGRVGETVREVLGVVESLDNATYLVVGGRRRTPVGKAVFGSATQSFLLNADLPVVTVMTEE